MNNLDRILLEQFKNFTCGVSDDNKSFSCILNEDLVSEKPSEKIYYNEEDEEDEDIENTSESDNYEYDDENFEQNYEYYSSGTNVLLPNEKLTSNGEFLMSDNGEFRLVIENDSKIYILPTGGGAIWSIGSTAKNQVLPYKLELENGYLILTNGANKEILKLNLNNSSKLELGNDGILRGYNDSNNVKWTSDN